MSVQVEHWLVTFDGRKSLRMIEVARVGKLIGVIVVLVL